MAHVYVIEKGDYEGGKTEAVAKRRIKAVEIATDMVRAAHGRWRKQDPASFSDSPVAVWRRDVGGEYVVIRRLEVQ